jgi:hypothetical protein
MDDDVKKMPTAGEWWLVLVEVVLLFGVGGLLGKTWRRRLRQQQVKGWRLLHAQMWGMD